MPKELISAEVSEYLETLVPKRPPELARMERHARKTRFPIIGPAVGQLCYLLARTIGDVMGREVVLVSSADETAFEVRGILEDAGLGRRGAGAGFDGGKGDHVFLSSGDVGWFRELGQRLLGPELSTVEQVVWD